MKTRTAGIVLTVGAVTLAIVTWLELFFGPQVEPAPSTPLVTPGAIPIHIVSFLGFLGMLLAFPTIGRVLDRRGGVAASYILAIGFSLGVIPHTVLDFSAIPMAFAELEQAQAVELTGRMYSVIGPMAMVGMLAIVAGFITLAVATRRAGVLPQWVAVVGFAAIPGVVLLEVVGGLLPSLPVPHGPVALDLAVAAYGVALWRLGAEVPATVRAEAVPAQA